MKTARRDALAVAIRAAAPVAEVRAGRAENGKDEVPALYDRFVEALDKWEVTHRAWILKKRHIEGRADTPKHPLDEADREQYAAIMEAAGVNNLGDVSHAAHSAMGAWMIS